MKNLMKLLFYFQLDDVVPVVKSMSNGKLKWAEVEAKYPKFEQQEATTK